MNIGVFFGSRSPEHDVSIITGELIISELKKLGHTVTPIYIGKDGQWYVNEALGSLKLFTAGGADQFKNYDEVFLDLEQSKGKMVFRKKGFASSKEYVVDLAFPALHGAYGEDGTIQGLFEMFNLPYVGCDVPASAITIDKVLTKLLCKQFGFPTVEFVTINDTEWKNEKVAAISHCTSALPWPMIVKPAKLGSSIGISKASNQTELETAIEVALHYGENVIVERAIKDLKDLTCAVLGNNEPRASLIQESVFTDEVFSYEDKYLRDGGAQLGNATSQLRIPAEIPETATSEIQKLSVEIFKKFGLSGIARVDFLYDNTDGKYYANEINPLPGTLYHHLWKASGTEMPELLTELIKLAQQKHAANTKFTHTFQSSLLQHANSIKLQIKNDDK